MSFVLIPWRLTMLEAKEAPEWANQALFCGTAAQIEVRMDKHVSLSQHKFVVPTLLAEEQLGSQVIASTLFAKHKLTPRCCKAYTFDRDYIAWVMDDKVSRRPSPQQRNKRV